MEIEGQSDLKIHLVFDLLCQNANNLKWIVLYLEFWPNSQLKQRSVLAPVMFVISLMKQTEMERSQKMKMGKGSPKKNRKNNN